MRNILALVALSLSLLAAQPSAPTQHTARVVETMDAGGYTYMKVSEGGRNYWVAVTATPVSVGQNVVFNEQMRMPNFKSRALNRTFDEILFASMVSAPGAHPQIGNVKPQNAPRNVLKKAEGGYSVAEVFEKRASLKGRDVRVRGKVTKISRGIMKRNWVHLEDGTGDAVTDDLVFTTENDVSLQAGDIVVATGRVETDRDFGFGYFYPVIIEKSVFARER